MCGNTRESDPYEPTKFQESNAILLAEMYLSDDDDEAYDRLESLLREMSVFELERLGAAARFLADTCRSAQHLAARGETGGT